MLPSIIAMPPSIICNATIHHSNATIHHCDKANSGVMLSNRVWILTNVEESCATVLAVKTDSEKSVQLPYCQSRQRSKNWGFSTFNLEEN